jgi:signal transduction histidine kinase
VSQSRRQDDSKVPQPVQGSDGRVRGAVVVFEDATRTKETRRLQEERVARIAHDLRQPLAVIRMDVEVLERMRENASGGEKGRVLDRTRKAASTLDRMIDDLLDVARIEAGELGLDRQETDLGALVRDVCERTPATEGRPIRIEVRGREPRARVDPGRVEQLLGNLLSNAAKYGAPGTSILVELDVGEAEARLSVTNEGPVIPEAERPQVFTRFFRATTAKGVRGTGLGLAICKGIAEAHGGAIDVACGPGERTTFRVRLPRG